MLKVETSSEVAHLCHEMKEAPENPWIKSCNGPWDRSNGALRGHEPHEGSNFVCRTKKKVHNDVLSALKGKYEKYTKKLESLPSFAIIMSMRDECRTL